MSSLSPNPRYRIYTTPGTYLQVLKDFLTFKVDVGNDCAVLEDSVCSVAEGFRAVCMPQARVGIYTVLRSLIRPGQEVILSPYTIADVVNMVVCAGGVPVFADIERETCNIDPDEIERLITGNTGAVLVTHLHGLSCPIDRIALLCREHGVPLVEDAAQAFGVRFEGRPVGTFGDAAVFSFGMYKNITSFLGGMVVTPNKELHGRMKKKMSRYPFMDSGFLAKKIVKGLATDFATSTPLFQFVVYHVFRFGHLRGIRTINRFVETELDLTGKEAIPESYLRRMTPFQARLVLAKLNQVDADTGVRIRYAEIYHRELAGIPELLLPPLRTDGSHIYTYFPVQYRDRKKLVRWLMEQRRDVAIQHVKNCADLPAFKPWFRDCANARATADQLVLLPTYPRYTENEVRKNIEAVKLFFRQQS